MYYNWIMFFLRVTVCDKSNRSCFLVLVTVSGLFYVALRRTSSFRGIQPLWSCHLQFHSLYKIHQQLFLDHSGWNVTILCLTSISSHPQRSFATRFKCVEWQITGFPRRKIWLHSLKQFTRPGVKQTQCHWCAEIRSLVRKSITGHKSVWNDVLPRQIEYALPSLLIDNKQ